MSNGTGSITECARRGTPPCLPSPDYRFWLFGMQKILIIAGIAIFLIGLAWPWLARIPLGRLPGDIIVSRPGFKFYFPVTTMILISIILSFIMWLLRK